MRDLYNLSLNADLVVLSACETGIGQLQRGEGIISLARAFSYAGARSILTSMWAVNDARTKDLMIAFYKNLKKEYSKDDALRRAKNDMLSSAKTQEQAHPFYWGGFIGIGDMRPVYKK
ncbi:MAG: CHAT domain-containing protein [Lewinellaceae bacterium]|nr:CHAT domain-containing protein [Lewinellaceae bacterium]